MRQQLADATAGCDRQAIEDVFQVGRIMAIEFSRLDQTHDRRGALILNLFRADKTRAMSFPRKLKTTAYNPAHLATALHLREI